LIVWSLETHQIVSKLDNAHDRAIYSVSWAGSTIASAGADNFVKLYRFDTTLHNYFTMEAHDNDINCVKLTEDKLITCSDDKTIKLWQLN
jgi:WD40 repeat protein